MAPPLLRMHGIHHAFGANQVLTGVDFELRAGEVHALLGLNGAGKSTLMKILAGALRPDRGTIQIDGQDTPLRSPREAQAAGITMIHQELRLAMDLSVAANVVLGAEPRRRGIFLDRPAARLAAADALERLGVHLDADRPAETLRVGEQQAVEIARALHRSSRILVMDEPTSALSDREVSGLFELMRKLKREGVGVIFISHRLAEVFAVADRVTVLRAGQVALTVEAARTSPEAVVQAMVGKELVSASHGSTPRKRSGVPRLEVQNLFLAAPVTGGRDRLTDISLALFPGEVLGLAGLMGAGRTELVECLAGQHGKRMQGFVRIDGRPIRLDSIRGAQRMGIALVTEDRARLGVIPDQTVRENLFLSRPRAIRGWLRQSEERRAYETRREELGIVAAHPELSIGSLSGGNQQKVLLARALESQPRVLLLDEPTRGIDPKAKEDIYTLIRTLADAGTSIILATSELSELFRVADRLLPLRQGRALPTIEAASLSERELLAMLAA